MPKLILRGRTIRAAIYAKEVDAASGALLVFLKDPLDVAQWPLL